MKAKRAICPGCGRSVAVECRVNRPDHGETLWAMNNHHTEPTGGVSCGSIWARAKDLEVKR